MIEKQKKISILRNFGVSLCQAGIKMIRTSFKLKPVLKKSYELRKFLKAQIGDKTFTFQDGDYYLLDWKTWQSIIEVDWTDKKKYIKEKYDCDNFSYSFKSRMAEIFDINSAASVHGHVYNKKTGKWIGGHLWNCIPTYENGKLHLYWYEAMNDNWVEHKKGEPIIMGKWIYVPLSLRIG